MHSASTARLEMAMGSPKIDKLKSGRCKMAKSLQMDISGAWSHVINRGHRGGGLASTKQRGGGWCVDDSDPMIRIERALFGSSPPHVINVAAIPLPFSPSHLYKAR